MLSARPVPLLFCCLMNPFLLGQYELATWHSRLLLVSSFLCLRWCDYIDM